LIFFVFLRFRRILWNGGMKNQTKVVEEGYENSVRYFRYHPLRLHLTFVQAGCTVQPSMNAPKAISPAAELDVF